VSDDTNEIQVAAEYFLHALDNLDWERFVACWSSDPSAFYPDDETRVDGRAAVLTRFRTMFDQIPLRASGPPYLHLNPRNLRINRYGDAGLVTFMLLDKPGPTPLRSLLFVREAGAWKLAHLHATNRVLV
jgi:ketosteroid isomerase-like protein